MTMRLVAAAIGLLLAALALHAQPAPPPRGTPVSDFGPYPALTATP